LEKSGFEAVLDYTRGSSGEDWRKIAIALMDLGF
jgi:hypothetical protein